MTICAQQASATCAAIPILLTNLDGTRLPDEFFVRAAATLQHESLPSPSASLSLSDVQQEGDPAQFSSESGCVKVAYVVGGIQKTIRMFVKRTLLPRQKGNAAHIDTALLRPWKDSQRVLLYGRNETTFYQHFAPKICDCVRLPKCVGVIHNFDVLQQHHEESPSLPALATAGSILMLESFNVRHLHAHEELDATQKLEDISFWQQSPLPSPTAVLKAIETVGELHKACWEDTNGILTKAAEELQRYGGWIHLSIRNPAEAENIIPHWNKFMQTFKTEVLAYQQSMASSTSSTTLPSVGEKLFRRHKEISDFLSANPSDSMATLIHGDCKAYNIIFPGRNAAFLQKKNEGDGDAMKAILIDFAQTGVGFGMSDIACLLMHSVAPSILDCETSDDDENSIFMSTNRDCTTSSSNDNDAFKIIPECAVIPYGERRFVAYYIHHIILPHIRSKHQHAQLSFSEETEQAIVKGLWRQYMYAVLDYGRFVVGRFGGDANHDSFARKRNNPNITLPNRDPMAAVRFAFHMDRLLQFLDHHHQASSGSERSEHINE